MEGMCKCMHHGASKVFLWVAGFAGVLFFWAVIFNQSLLNFSADNLFKIVVVCGVLVYLSKHCRCCNSA